MQTGTFVPFVLDFERLSPAEQAGRVLAQARAAVDAGQAGAAIVYSANHRQTLKIREVYAEGGWRTGIRGANQAEVMTALEALLERQAPDLRGRVRIAPVSTMLYPEDADPLEVAREDLREIQALLDAGWRVLGWQNQRTVGTDRPYAVGGGVAGALPPELAETIQSTLGDFARRYPAPSEG